jgi:hypothetical protein
MQVRDIVEHSQLTGYSRLQRLQQRRLPPRTIRPAICQPARLMTAIDL